VGVDEKIGDKLDKKAFKRRDLLSLLLRANMSTDLPPSQRMTDDDVLARKYLTIFKSLTLMNIYFRGTYVPGCWS